MRRQSNDDEDLFISYIAGMDTFAKGLRVAAKLLEDKVFINFINNRYRSYNDGIGKKINSGNITLEELYEYSLKNDKVEVESGKQELLESILNQYILNE